MIENLQIRNFKSIKHLMLDCKKVNIFIGKPNTGKSNILESLGIFSIPFSALRLKNLIRFEILPNLFYDNNLEEKIEIATNVHSFEMYFREGAFYMSGGDRQRAVFQFNIKCYDYTGASMGVEGSGTSPFKFYRFDVVDNFPRREADFLLPPHGENLLTILLTNKTLKKVVADLFSEFSLRIVLKPQENKIEVQKEMEDVIISYPYSLVSDTLQRVVFHLTAIETNRDSILIFEEPEAHAFPYYTKYLAERIALDETNQFFISTHNPYFLLSVLEKTPGDKIGIFITFFQEYQTKVRPLKEEELPEMLDLNASVFFNLDRFLE